jgi:hypothetical protein
MSALTSLGSGMILAKLEWMPQRLGEYDSVMHLSLLSLSQAPCLADVMHADTRTTLQYTGGLLRGAPACRELRARAYCSEFVALPYPSSPRCASSETVLPKAQDDFQPNRSLRFPYADRPSLYAILMRSPLTYYPASVICIKGWGFAHLWGLYRDREA